MKMVYAKSLAAVVLVLPLMAYAGSKSEDKKTFETVTFIDRSSDDATYKFSLDFKNGASKKNNFDYAPGRGETYDVVLNASWVNRVYWNEETSTTKFTEPLSSYFIKVNDKNFKGTVIDTNPNDNKLQVSFSGLSRGDYKVVFTGFWDAVKGIGAKNNEWEWNEGKTGKVSLSLSNVRMVTPVPEPESYALLLAGLGLIGGITLRRKDSSKA